MGNSAAEMFGRTPRKKAGPLTQPVHTFVMPEQLIGVEVEAEATDDGHLPSRGEVGGYWEIKSDGSLMRGQEYVLLTPMAGDQLSRAITMFFQTARLQRMATSSTHIHLDMEEEHTSPATIQLVFALVFMLEPVLWQAGDPTRQWCGFTHSIHDAPASLFETLFSENFNVKKSHFIELARSMASARYYGLNVNALSRYGSLEFRYFPTATSEEELAGWVNLVQSFKRAALSLGDMRALASTVDTEEGYTSLVNTYFAPWASIINTHVPHTQARKMFDKLTDMYRNITVTSNYDSIVSTNEGFSKIAKKKVRRVPPEARRVVEQDETLTEPADTGVINYVDYLTSRSLTSMNIGSSGVRIINLDLMQAPMCNITQKNTILIGLVNRVYVPARSSAGNWVWRDVTTTSNMSQDHNYRISNLVRTQLVINAGRFIASEPPSSERQDYMSRIIGRVSNMSTLAPGEV